MTFARSVSRQSSKASLLPEMRHGVSVSRLTHVTSLRGGVGAAS